MVKLIFMDSTDTQIKEIIKESYPNIKEFNPAQNAVIDSGFLEESNQLYNSNTNRKW